MSSKDNMFKQEKNKRFNIDKKKTVFFASTAIMSVVAPTLFADTASADTYSWDKYDWVESGYWDERWEESGYYHEEQVSAGWEMRCSPTGSVEGMYDTIMTEQYTGTDVCIPLGEIKETVRTWVDTSSYVDYYVDTSSYRNYKGKVYDTVSSKYNATSSGQYRNRTIANYAPVIQNTTLEQIVYKKDSFDITIGGFDQEGDEITYSITNNNPDLFEATLVDNKVTVTGVQKGVGTIELKVTSTNSLGFTESNTKTFTVDVRNNPPKLERLDTPNHIVLDDNTNYSYTGLVSDVEEEDITVTLTTQGKSFNHTTKDNFAIELVGSEIPKGYTYTDNLTVDLFDGSDNITSTHSLPIIKVDSASDYNSDMQNHDSTYNSWTSEQHEKFYNSYSALDDLEKGYSYAKLKDFDQKLATLLRVSAVGDEITDYASLVTYNDKVTEAFNALEDKSTTVLEWFERRNIVVATAMLGEVEELVYNALLPTGELIEGDTNAVRSLIDEKLVPFLSLKETNGFTLDVVEEGRIAELYAKSDKVNKLLQMEDLVQAGGESLPTSKEIVELLDVLETILDDTFASGQFTLRDKAIEKASDLLVTVVASEVEEIKDNLKDMITKLEEGNELTDEELDYLEDLENLVEDLVDKGADVAEVDSLLTTVLDLLDLYERLDKAEKAIDALDITVAKPLIEGLTSGDRSLNALLTVNAGNIQNPDLERVLSDRLNVLNEKLDYLEQLVEVEEEILNILSLTEPQVASLYTSIADVQAVLENLNTKGYTEFTQKYTERLNEVVDKQFAYDNLMDVEATLDVLTPTGLDEAEKKVRATQFAIYKVENEGLSAKLRADLQERLDLVKLKVEIGSLIERFEDNKFNYTAEQLEELLDRIKDNLADVVEKETLLGLETDFEERVQAIIDEFEKHLGVIKPLDEKAKDAIDEAEKAVDAIPYDDEVAQDKLDEAQTVIDTLPDGGNKDNYQDQLDKLIEEKENYDSLVDEATKLVEKVENTLDPQDFTNAQTAVDKLRDSEEKTDLQNRLDVVKEKILTSNAGDLVLKFESTLLLEDYNLAKEAVDLLQEGAVKSDYLNRLDTLHKQVVEAITAVELAESTPIKINYVAALDKVNALKDSPMKDILLDRLSVVSWIIKQAENKQPGVEETTPETPVIDTPSVVEDSSQNAKPSDNEDEAKAKLEELLEKETTEGNIADLSLEDLRDLIESLPDSEYKDMLLALVNKMIEIEKSHNKEVAVEEYLIEEVQEVIMDLDRSLIKDALIIHGNSLKASNKAIIAVEAAEEYKSEYDLDVAKTAVERVTNKILKPKLEERLKAIVLSDYWGKTPQQDLNQEGKTLQDLLNDLDNATKEDFERVLGVTIPDNIYADFLNKVKELVNQLGVENVTKQDLLDIIDMLLKQGNWGTLDIPIVDANGNTIYDEVLDITKKKEETKPVATPTKVVSKPTTSNATKPSVNSSKPVAQGNSYTPTYTPSYSDLYEAQGVGVSETASTPVNYPTSFEDEAMADIVKDMTAEEVLEMLETGLFNPVDTVTRGQYAVIVAKAAGLEPSDSNAFADTSGLWYDGYITVLHEKGIMTGASDNVFDYKGTVAKEETLATLNRLLRLVGMTNPNSGESNGEGIELTGSEGVAPREEEETETPTEDTLDEVVQGGSNNAPLKIKDLDKIVRYVTTNTQ